MTGFSNQIEWKDGLPYVNGILLNYDELAARFHALELKTTQLRGALEDARMYLPGRPGCPPSLLERVDKAMAMSADAPVTQKAGGDRSEFQCPTRVTSHGSVYRCTSYEGHSGGCQEWVLEPGALPVNGSADSGKP